MHSIGGLHFTENCGSGSRFDSGFDSGFGSGSDFGSYFGSDSDYSCSGCSF